MNIKFNKIMPAIIVLLLGIGLVGYISSQQEQPKTNTEISSQDSSENTETANKDANIISYQGEEGKTALELLKKNANVQTQDSAYGEYVVSINDLDGEGNAYWSFYINDTLAPIGAGEYITNSSDKIEWRLE